MHRGIEIHSTAVRADRRPRWSRSALALGALSVVVCAGCSGGSPGAGQATEPAAAALAAPSGTSGDPLARAEAGLRGAVATYYQAYQAAVAAPGDEQAVERLLAVYGAGGPGAKDITTRMKALARQGYAARSGPEGYYVVQGIDVSSAAPGGTAQVTTCTYYDGVTYSTRRKGSDGKPLTVDNSPRSGRTRFRFVLQAGSWKLVGGDVLATWKGVNRCPPR